MQELLNMVRYAAVFYLLEQMVLNLLPGKMYERYVRFYLGLLMVLLLLQPVFKVFRLVEQMDAAALVQELEREVIDKERAISDPDAPRLTSFVGIDRLTEVDLNLRPMELQRGDVLLLCSDGISGVLTPPELLECMSLDPEEGVRLLEGMVLEKNVMGQDNFTGILIACQ